jgi:ABC-type amino acid transport substrate-binding protein
MQQSNTILSILVIIVGFFISTPSWADQNVTYDRIMKTGKIRAGYFVWPPFFNKDPNTKQLSGIYYDIMTALAERLELKVTWPMELNFGTYIQDLASQKYDMEVGGWPMATRGKLTAYSRPYFYIGFVPVVRADDHRFDHDISLINSSKVTVATLDGETSQIVRRQRFPMSQELSIAQNDSPTTLLMNLISKKADVTFLDTVFVHEFSKKNPGMVRPIWVGQPLKLVPQSLTLSFDEPKLKMMMDTVIEEVLLDGTIDRILNTYDPNGELFYRVSPPYQPMKAGK